MNKKIINKKLVFAFLVFLSSTHAQPFLHKPIEGKYGKDYIIVNYVDWGNGDTIMDNHCGTKTYNGHQGTDFVIRNFRLMDSGIYVLAAASGKVNFAKDGLFDRGKKSDTSKKLGNYIGISHPNGYQTYYGHLKKNSLLVKEGDNVLAGQRIAKVGSSGNSTDPHLHFEIWYDSSFYVDPFNGTCGNSISLWLNNDEYDTSFKVWMNGMCNFIPNIDTLREQPIDIQDFDNTDEAINYWSILYGLRKNDEVKIQWIQPNGELWFEYQINIDRDYWYYYYWSYILYQTGQPLGNWKVVLRKNNEKIDEKDFKLHIKLIENITTVNKNKISYSNFENKIVFCREEAIGKIVIYNIEGKIMKSINNFDFKNNFELDKSELNKGLYFFMFYNINNQQPEKLTFKID